MEIQDVKNQLSISVVLENYRLRVDRNHRMCCPWHADKTPSLQIYPKTNTWTCFSSNCSAGSGDVIDFIMKYEKVTKHEAIMKSKELLGITRSAKPTIKEGVELSRIAVLAKYYQSTVHSFARNKVAKAYAESRVLSSTGIGYCAYTIGKTWNKNLKEQAERIGLLNIKNCLIFPMKDEKNQIVSFYGRSLSTDEHTKHFYLKGGFKGLYPGYPKQETKQLIFTESIIDASTLRQH